MDKGVERRIGGRKDISIRLVFEDQVNVNLAATVNFSDDGLLISSGVPLDIGTEVTIFPLSDELDARLFKLKGKVVRSFEDVLVSAYADDRFHMGIKLELNETQRQVLARYLDTRN